MKHLFIINPAAGSHDRTDWYRAQIEANCAGLDYEIRVSQAPGQCRQIARAAAETGEEVRLYACGGDGTLNEVASGAAGFSAAPLEPASSQCSCRDKNIAPGGTRAESFREDELDADVLFPHV